MDQLAVLPHRLAHPLIVHLVILADEGQLLDVPRKKLVSHVICTGRIGQHMKLHVQRGTLFAPVLFRQCRHLCIHIFQLVQKLFRIAFFHRKLDQKAFQRILQVVELCNQFRRDCDHGRPPVRVHFQQVFTAQHTERLPDRHTAHAVFVRDLFCRDPAARLDPMAYNIIPQLIRHTVGNGCAKSSFHFLFHTNHPRFSQIFADFGPLPCLPLMKKHPCTAPQGPQRNKGRHIFPCAAGSFFQKRFKRLWTCRLQ